jgi:alpha-tubulin suppressor-like RCC1 family protein
MWGTNRQGQLGCGQLKNNHEIVELILVPIENQYFKSKQLKVIDLSLGSTHCLALVEDNKGKHSMYAWGSAEDGECGKVK